MTYCGHQPRNTKFQKQMDRYAMKEKLKVVPTMSEQESNRIDKVPTWCDQHTAYDLCNRLIPESEYQSLLAENARLRAVMDAVPTISAAMKAEHMGEYSVDAEDHCTECEGDDEECTNCDGFGVVQRKIIVPWTTCKLIFERMFATLIREQQPKASEDDK